MACNCGGKAAPAAKTWVVTARDGEKTSYSTDVEAAAAAIRLGGSYRAQ